MSTDWTCNSSFWTKEEDKIFEDTLAIYFTGDNDNLLTKMEQALPWKSRDDIINHYNILLEDVEAIESGRVPLPHYPEMQRHPNQKSRFSKTDLQRRRGVAWTEEEHWSFLRGLAIYGRSDWRSISRHCVISRTPSQVASHAQKYFHRLKAINQENRRAIIHDITSVDAEAAGTSQVRNTENMIWPAYAGSQAVESTSNESMFYLESTNAEQVTAVAGGESSRHSAAFVNGICCLYPGEKDGFILRIDDLIVEPEDANGSGFLVDAGRSLLPSKQPCTAASTECHSHPITRIGSELEALIAAYTDKGNDITSIFDAGKAPTSHAMLSNAAHSGMRSYPVANIEPQNTVAGHSRMCSYPVASFGANCAPHNTVAAQSGMTSFGVASIGAYTTPQTTVAAHRGMTNFGVASIGAYNPPQTTATVHSGTASFAAASIGANNAVANNAPQNTGVAQRGITSFGAASIGAYNAPQTTLPAHRGMTRFGAASISSYNAPQTTMAAHSGMASFAGCSIGANNAPQNMVADNSGMTGFAAASIGAYNAPQTTMAAQSGITSSAVATFGATNATQNTVAAHVQLPPVAPSTNFGGGGWPNLNTSIDGEGFFDLDDLFTDQMFRNW